MHGQGTLFSIGTPENVNFVRKYFDLRWIRSLRYRHALRLGRPFCEMATTGVIKCFFFVGLMCLKILCLLPVPLKIHI